VARELAGVVRDEWHHIDDALSRMDPLVRTEVETGDAGPGQFPDALGDLVLLAGQREDGAMVVGIAMEVEQARTGDTGQLCQKSLVTAVADVDDALDGHGSSLPPWARRGRRGPPWDGLVSGDGNGLRHPPAAQNATAFALGASTPHAVVDVVLEGVLQTGRGHGTLAADLLRHQHSHPVTREEEVRRNFLAFPPGHPFGIHDFTPFSRIILKKKGQFENNWPIGTS
jgi:hypothetical protein